MELLDIQKENEMKEVKNEENNILEFNRKIKLS